MKKIVVLVLVLALVLALSAAIAETYSTKAKVSKIEGKEAILVLNGLEYKVQKGILEEGDIVSLTMWDMKTSSRLDDVVMFAMCGVHAVHVELMGGTTPSRTTAAK